MKRTLAFLISLIMVFSLFPLAVMATTENSVQYLDASGQTQVVDNVTVINTDADLSGLPTPYTLTSGWYIVTGSLTAGSKITVTGSVNLILSDGSSLTVNGGSGGNAAISVIDANSLTIYAQSTGTSMGSLIATGGNNGGAGIGGSNPGQGNNGGNGGNAGTITINGGVVTAKSSGGGAGIGGGRGDVAAPDSNGYGDGGNGGNGGTITINGGVVTATSSQGAGIGGGRGGPAGGGYGIGGNGGNGGTVTINGGTVIVTGGIGGGTSGIMGSPGHGWGGGTGSGGSGGTTIITGGSVNSTIQSPPTGTSLVIATVGSPVVANAAVTSITVNGAAYGSNDVSTDGSGKLYLWLPSGSLDMSVTAGGQKYIGTISGGAVTLILATYGVSLDQTGTYTFPSAAYGYAAVSPLSVTVTNTGNAPTGALTVALSGTSAASFTVTNDHISGSSLAVSGTDTFDIVPNTGRSGGTYTATVTVSGGNGITASFPVTFTVGRATQSISISGLGSNYTYGAAPFTVSASGGSGGGAVTYVSSDNTVADLRNGADKDGNTAADQAAVTILKAGTFTVTATKAADANYAQASVMSGTVTVSRATPNVDLQAAGGASISNPIVLTATVSKPADSAGTTPQGAVTFSEGGATLAANVPLVNGAATFTVNNPAGGSHTYTAAYSGETGKYNANSANTTKGVGLADQATFAIATPTSLTYGDGGFTLAVDPSSPGSGTGAVSFSVPAGNGVLNVTTGSALAVIVGAGTVTVTAIKAADSSYNQATTTLDVTVNPRNITNVMITVSGGPFTYTGSQLQPNFSVSDGTIAITSGDYTNTYGANVNAGAGAGSVTLTGQGNYTGTKTATFDIGKLSLAGAVITLAGTSFTATGSAITPAITSVKVGGVAVPAADYDVTYANSTVVGTATVTVTAKAASVNFTGSASTTFTITAAPTYALTVAAGAGGAVSGTASGSYAAGTQINVTAAANSGYSFSGWTVSGATVSSASVNPLTFAMPANAVSITANFTYNGSNNGGYYYGGGYSSYTYTNASLGATSISFDKNGGKDITVTLNSGSYSLLGLKNGSYTLVKGTDYTVNGNQVTIKASYLNTLATGSQVIIFDMNGGTDPQLTILVSDTTPKGTPPAAWVNPFADVNAGDWFYGDVEYIYTHGLMVGTSMNPMMFSPNMNLTRGMIVTILYREAGSPDVSKLPNPFGDVTGGTWYADAVKWAVTNGIVSGIGGGKYDPDASITRQDLTVILYRYAQLTGMKLPVAKDFKGFTDDADIANYAKDAIETFFKAGILSGYPDGSVHPIGTATRAEVAAILHRFLVLTKG